MQFQFRRLHVQVIPQLPNSANLTLGRVTVDLNHVYKTRQTISLVYTSLIAFASLVIAAGFLYFGWRLNKLTSRIESRSKYKVKQFAKVAMLTLF